MVKRWFVRLIGAGASGAAAATLVAGPAAASGLDPAKLRATLDAGHKAGMYGLYSSVRDGDQSWEGASGVADVRTGRPVTPGMQHRVGSTTKSLTAAAVLQQVERGRIRLDAPIGRYLPRTVPGERGHKITVRMLLNHTSGIGDYVDTAFPSLPKHSPQSLDANRLRTFRTSTLIKYGLDAPPTNAPGAGWSYSNTNFLIAGQLLERVTHTKAETYITRHVIRRAGLRHTYFPTSPAIQGPHARMYEALYGNIDPPRDYSVYDMSWLGTAGALVSTMDDLNRYYRALLTGKVIGKDALAQMQRTVPVHDEHGTLVMRYGLGLYALPTPCGEFWGHDGGVFGAATQSLASPDGKRQISIGINLRNYQRLDDKGHPLPHPIDKALDAHLTEALCGGTTTPSTTAQHPPNLPHLLDTTRR